MFEGMLDRHVVISSKNKNKKLEIQLMSARQKEMDMYQNCQEFVSSDACQIFGKIHCEKITYLLNC
jgi:hypothetical protein